MRLYLMKCLKTRAPAQPYNRSGKKKMYRVGKNVPRKSAKNVPRLQIFFSCFWDIMEKNSTISKMRVFRGNFDIGFLSACRTKQKWISPHFHIFFYIRREWKRRMQTTALHTHNEYLP